MPGDLVAGAPFLLAVVTLPGLRWRAIWAGVVALAATFLAPGALAFGSLRWEGEVVRAALSPVLASVAVLSMLGMALG